MPEGKGKKLDWIYQNVTPKGGKKLLICGGDLDAPSAYQMVKSSKYKSMSMACVAPPNGENISSLTDNALEYANSFDEIISFADNDKAGDKYTRDLVDLFGSKVLVAKYGEEGDDVSDMLTSGRQDEFINAIFNATMWKPKSLITVADVFEDAIRMPEYGKQFPWPSLTELTYGRRLGDGYYWGAGVKLGKSEALNQMVAHIIEKEGGKPLVAKPEEQPGLTVKKIAGKIFKKNFNDPSAVERGIFTQKELQEAIKAVDNHLLMYNRYGDMTWDELSSCIRHAVLVEGTTDVFIDPITVITDGIDGAEGDRLLKKMVRDLDNMAKDIGFTFHCFCHLNNPPPGKTWEEGKEPRSAYFANSRGMMRACQYMIGIARNKYADDIAERNTSKFILLDDRNFGRYAKFPVKYNPETGEYLE
jgi:twinkle protein